MTAYASTASTLYSRAAVAVTALLAVLNVAACRSSVRYASTLSMKIGVLADFNTPDGDGIRHGVAMAVDEINAGGGISGRRIEVVEVNTDRSPAKVIQGYQRLAGFDHVVAVVGISTSAVFGVMPLLSQYKVPLLCSGAAADRLTEMVAEDYDRYKYFFRVMHKSSELGEAVADYVRGLLYGRLGMRRFAIMVEDDIWTRAIRDAWVRMIDGMPGAHVVYSGSFSTETQDFVPLLSEVLRHRPDYVLDASSAVDATTYLKQWAGLGGGPIGAIPTGAGTSRYFQELGSNGLGVSSVATIPSPENPLSPRAEAWSTRYQHAYGSPEYTSAYSYDAINVLATAIRLAEDGRASLVRSLESVRVEGVVGTWQFGRDHQGLFGPGYRRIPVIRYDRPTENGYRVVWPADMAAARSSAGRRGGSTVH